MDLNYFFGLPSLQLKTKTEYKCESTAQHHLELHNVVSAQAKPNQNQKPPQTQILMDTWRNS